MGTALAEPEAESCRSAHTFRQMRIVALVLAAATLGLPAAAASPRATVPGLVYTPGYGNSILMRFDPLTLERSGPRVRLGGPASSWGRSPGGRYLAVASRGRVLTVVEAATFRVTWRAKLAEGSGLVHAISWVRPDRVLAVVDTPGGALVVAVDPGARRIVRRTRLARPFAHALTRVPGGLVFLTRPRSRIAPAQLAVADAEGRVRLARVSRAAIGSTVHDDGRFDSRSPGLAVDPATRRAYVFYAGDGVAQVDLDTLTVQYRGAQRTLAKSIGGSFRTAHWLGDGLIALSGADTPATAPGTRAKPIGLRLVDVRAWTSRTIDPAAEGFTVAGKLLLVADSVHRYGLKVTAFGVDGRERYRLDLTGSTWLRAQGARGYVCRDAVLTSIVDLRTGAVLRNSPAATRCPTLLVSYSRF